MATLTEREQYMAIVANERLSPSDAIIMLEGDGYCRVNEVADLYKKGIARTIVFSGGITDYNYGSYPLADVLPKMLEQGIRREDIIHEDKSQNTRDQAVEIVSMAQELGWRKVVLVASPEHQYRAYLTFLREVIDSHSDLIIYNSPAHDLGWFDKSEWGVRLNRLTQEFERIERYSQLGHLASYKEAIDYQHWKEKQ